MKNSRFSHIFDVFSFTIKNAMTGKAFVVMTYVMPIIFLLIFAGINIGFALNSDDEIERHAQTVYVIDETGLENKELVMDAMEQSIDRELYQELKLELSDKDDAKAICKEHENDKNFMVLKFTIGENNKTKVTAVIPDWSEIESDEYDEIISYAKSAMSGIKIMTSGLDMQTLIYMTGAVMVDVTEAGEPAEDLAITMIKMLAPMLVILVIYLMTILYGQSIGKVVSAEKNSKLMEMILTSIRPEALIIGKVMAMSIIAFLQMSLWVLGGVVGYFIGDFAGKAINPDFENVIGATLKGFADMTAGAFKPEMVVIAAFSLFFGFTFYCFIAGVFGSFVSKPEELSSCMGIYTIIVMIGFFGSYFPRMEEDIRLIRLISFIPITSAFGVPADIALGTLSLGESIIALAILVVSCLIVGFVSAKIYRNKVFYNGKNILEKTTGLFKRM